MWAAGGAAISTGRLLPALFLCMMRISGVLWKEGCAQRRILPVRSPDFRSSWRLSTCVFEVAVYNVENRWTKTAKRGGFPTFAIITDPVF